MHRWLVANSMPLLAPGAQWALAERRVNESTASVHSINECLRGLVLGDLFPGVIELSRLFLLRCLFSLATARMRDSIKTRVTPWL